MAQEQFKERLLITTDCIFKLVFNQKRFAKKLFSLIFQRPFDKLTALESEKTILDKMAEGKSVNLDIFAKDAFGNLYDLEMQNFCRSDEELDLRTRTYERMLDVHCMKRGVKNKKLPYTFVIFICNYHLFDRKQKVYFFDTTCVNKRNIMLNNKRIEVLISAKNRNIDGIPIDPELDALLEYIHDSTKIKTDFVKKIDEEVTKINEDPVKLEAIMRYNLHIEDIKEDSFAKGEASGFTKGEASGFTKGEASGFTKGEARNNERVIINCLKSNMTLETIVNISESTIKKIKEIAKKHNLPVRA